ncbi:hypothetical protein GCM10027084_24650 [Pseudoxanthomonas sangjuensis]|uniref:PDZ domain-containing protein n=1 Tax=Pseudoxanthomonas sangjuensis TaxID=1503750 RepID=UPI001391C663|nr:PDZ domain-containing protein [Pseudoxanthomonas sangjuensis]KAF1711032.1 hypothetical protein CSC71_10050 [Pseudoxanthomonas sangjuensis]
MKTSRLAAALLACFALDGGATFAQSSPKPADADKELAAAREDLARAARRVAELTRDTLPQAMEQVQQSFRFSRRPVIGVVLAPDAAAGVRIGGVTPDSAAAKAGLKAGDRIVSLNGTEILGNTPQLRIDNALRLFEKLEENKPVKIGYVRDGRMATVSATPKLDDRVFVFNDADGGLTKISGPVSIRHRKDGAIEIEGSGIEGAFKADSDAIKKQVDQAFAEIHRIAPDGKGGFEVGPLVEAFRWSGLNLAAIDPQLGRYFGTDKGVLVISSGEDLGELQAGDVIQKIDGKPVDTPREAMAALRAKPAGSAIEVEFLRDRKSQRASVKAPKAVPFRLQLPSPPAPPAAPAAPPAPDTAAMPAPPAPPAAPAPIVRSERHVVIAGDDGKVFEWSDGGDGELPAPPAPPASPVPPVAPKGD